MSLLLKLLLSLTVQAAPVEWLHMPKSIPVYVEPRVNAPLLLMTKEGERMAIRRRGDVFTRVQINRGGKWRAGFVLTADLENPEISTPRGDFGFGLGGLYTYLRHSKKQFETEDQVEYTTTDFTSTSFSPFVTVQYGQQDFWRLHFAYRMTDFSSVARTDVAGASSKDVTLEHTLVSGMIQKMWTPFVRPVFYCGVGLEAARALEAHLVLGGLTVPVQSSDLPTYLGGHVAVGGQLDMGRWLSAFAELRLGGYFNQSPVILGAEGALGILIWP